MAQLPQSEQGRQKQPAENIEDAGVIWMQAIAHEWREELADPREDIYTMEDGEPIADGRSQRNV